jgi:hypothetical protein
MRYWKLLGITVVAVCALGVMMSVAAFGALPTILPTTITAYTGKNVGTAELQALGGKTVKCAKAKGEGTIEQTKALGLFHIHFESCTAEVLGQTGPCTGLSDETGTILSLGSWHLVYDTLTPTLGAAILYLLDNVHFTCTILGVTALVLVPLGGMVLCLVANPTATTKVFEFGCKKQATGITAESKYYNEAGTLVSISTLLSAENEKTAEQAVEIASGTVETSVAAELMI